MIIRARRRGPGVLLAVALWGLSVAAAITLLAVHHVHRGCTNPVQQPARVGGVLSFAALAVSVLGLSWVMWFRNGSRRRRTDHGPPFPLASIVSPLLLAAACSLFYVWSFHTQCFSG